MEAFGPWHFLLQGTPSACPALECLEERCLLMGGVNAFARSPSDSVVDPGGVTVQFQQGDLTLPRRRIGLGIVLRPDTGDSLVLRLTMPVSRTLLRRDEGLAVFLASATRHLPRTSGTGVRRGRWWSLA